MSLKVEQHAFSGVLLQYRLQTHSLSKAISCKAQSFGPEMQMSLGTMGTINNIARALNAEVAWGQMVKSGMGLGDASI